jgi:hypothetical protein
MRKKNINLQTMSNKSGKYQSPATKPDAGCARAPSGAGCGISIWPTCFIRFLPN